MCKLTYSWSPNTFFVCVCVCTKLHDTYNKTSYDGHMMQRLENFTIHAEEVDLKTRHQISINMKIPRMKINL